MPSSYQRVWPVAQSVFEQFYRVLRATMNKFCMLFCTVFFLCAVPASGQAVEIWHSDSFFGGQGTCVHTFNLDALDSVMAEDGGVADLQLTIALLDKAGNDIDVVEARVEGVIGDSPSNRYGGIAIYDQCEDNAAFAIKKATGIIGGNVVDLIQSEKISMRHFVSLPIHISGQPEPADRR